MEFKEALVKRKNVLDLYVNPNSLSEDEKVLTEKVLDGLKAESTLLHTLSDKLLKESETAEDNTTTVTLDIEDEQGKLTTLSVEHHKVLSFGGENHTNKVTFLRTTDLSGVYDSIQAKFDEAYSGILNELEETIVS